MTFRSPGLLAALVIIPAFVAAYAAAHRRRSQRAARLATEGLVATAVQARPGPSRKSLRHVSFAVFVVALAVLIVGLARPMSTIKTPRREGTVILAIDVSNSMMATDIKPSRNAAARAAAKAFVGRQPPQVRIGVVGFGDGAVAVQAPTSVHADVLRAIDRLSLGGGTSVGQGVLTSLDTIAGKSLTINPNDLSSDAGGLNIGYFGSASIVVFSDGENTGGPDPVVMAQVASVAGVRVDTVGVGTEAGTVVKINGFSVATALDKTVLQKMAAVSNGSYHTGGDATALAAISRTIDVKFKIVSQHTEITGLFAVAGAVLLLLGALLSVRWQGRVV
jgi:Ca-activated chloride channel family protein